MILDIEKNISGAWEAYVMAPVRCGHIKKNVSYLNYHEQHIYYVMFENSKPS